MSVTYRTITPEEFPAFAHADSLAFGHILSDADLEIERAALEFDRAVAAFDGDAPVGTSATLSLELTVPGGATLPTGGLTWAAVIPTHHRRGILTEMIVRQLAISRERGESVAALQASEGAIYGRFGYGPATWTASVSVSTSASAFRHRIPSGPAGRSRRDGHDTCRILDDQTAAAVLPEVFDRHRHIRHGSLARTAGLWHVLLTDPEHHRNGAGRLYHVAHHDAAGSPDGYASYRLKRSWGDDGIQQGSLMINELIALDPEAYARLWRYCLDMDLTATVLCEGCAPDEPLRWLLADPRQLRTIAVFDCLWLRLLDVPGCLAARGYAGEGRLVIEVWEPADAASGRRGRPSRRRYLLEAARDGAGCAPTRRAADLVLDVADLSSAYLGGTSFTALAAAGRVHVERTSALELADALFVTPSSPLCTTHF